MYKLFIKRIVDFSVAFVILLVISPIFLLLMLFLSLANEGKPFFVQRRPGKNGAIFSIVKFKTMTDKKDVNGNLLSDSERLTQIGSFVRKTSLDELPQLLNVIKGDMCLIGPRPLLPEYLSHYSEIQNKRHEVKPGITGWAQVNRRNAISWEKKFEYDVWYVENMSFLLDVKILFLTIKKVVKSENISQEGSVSMDYFKGNK
jgi:lipopolysaccharide/colanic/teichoic acid biosynthesis glycosyltransferase